MGMLTRFFAAFCVATVIAQMLIFCLMLAKGNLHSGTLTQALALINGIDVTGDQVEKAFQQAQDSPMPTHEEVLQQRAKMSLELQNQNDSIQREKDMVNKLLAELASKTSEFDRRRQDFYSKVDDLEKKLVKESLKEVQRTIEELVPDQAKEQLVRMLQAERMDDVIAIVKVLDPAKRKKILNEFAEPEETDKLHDVLMRMLAGEPTASLIKDQRRSLSDNPDLQ